MSGIKCTKPTNSDKQRNKQKTVIKTYKEFLVFGTCIKSKK